jgi:hypothetical protein
VAAGSGVQRDSSWQPEFPGQREPFRAGHTLSLKHGAYSARVVEPLAAELLASYLEERPDLAWAHGTVERLARTEARALLLDRWLADHGMFDEEGEFRSRVIQEWRFLERQGDSICHSLGWTPRARAAMMRDESLAVSPWVPDEQRQSVAAEQVSRWLDPPSVVGELEVGDGSAG